MGFHAGVQAAAYGIRCSVGKLQKVYPGIGSLLRIAFHSFPDGGQKVVSQHAVTPDDLCCGVAVPHYFQESQMAVVSISLTSSTSRVPAHSCPSSTAD